jgi:hypothetical protein
MLTLFNSTFLLSPQPIIYLYLFYLFFHLFPFTRPTYIAASERNANVRLSRLSKAFSKTRANRTVRDHSSDLNHISIYSPLVINRLLLYHFRSSSRALLPMARKDRLRLVTWAS